jgi:hypothetical protein
MNSVEHNRRPIPTVNRVICRPLLAAIACLVAAHSLKAADALYQNDGIIAYPGTVGAPPVIDATNFVNTGTFLINFTDPAILLTGYLPFYETSDTLNYTNTGLMVANTGFQFDTQSTGTGARTQALSFNNSGTIECGSTNDFTDPFSGQLYLLDSVPQCVVNASNVISPGTIDVGVEGQILITSQNANLAHGFLNVEGGAGSGSGFGAFGTDTNNEWDPFFDLTPTNATSSLPFLFQLTNSLSYFNVVGAGTSNVVTRAVFLQDTSPANVSYAVYFGTAGIGLGSGDVTIQWAGTYQNPGTGSYTSNYLYLNDDYVLGASTNVALSLNGYPDNFTFTESRTPQLTTYTPTPSGFTSTFPVGSLTNVYSYAQIQLLPTGEGTNAVVNGDITNLFGRIEITASNDLDLSYSQITGLNYLSIEATNQFDGSAGALIQAPYSDLNVGVTNGFLNISNLMASSFLDWGGNIVAWSTRFVVVDSTGVTNDYRVLIVGSQLNPTTVAQIRNLVLHSTNVVVSDYLNIYGSFNSDAQNLTVTTNGIGVGANSVEGGLNVENAGIYWGSSLPNLRNLTNNGVIIFSNLVQFIGNSNNITIVPPVPAVAASGTLSEVAGRSNVQPGNKVVIGTNQYIFESVLTNAVASQVKIASTFDGSMSNLIAAVNHAVAGAGTLYGTNMATNGLATAGPLTNHVVIVTASIAGVAGNSVTTANSVATTNLVWGGTALSGGADLVPGVTNTATATTPYANFINDGLVSDQGATIWANNFVSGGTLTNGLGSFVLSSVTTALTNGGVTAAGDISVTADSLLISNTTLRASRSLTLTATNLLTDGVVPFAGGTNGVTNASIWTVGGISTSVGFNLPIKPQSGDLLGTTVTNIGPAGKLIVNTWSGQDRGYSLSGYTNNAVVGRLVLDSQGLAPACQFYFTGPNAGVTNALYVDDLELRDYATNFGNEVVSNVSFNNNLVIYYAQANVEGFSLAEKLNHYNHDHFRWVSNYAGYYSSTNIVYPDGTTNAFNAALAQSSVIDSSGSGIVNSQNPTPFFISSQVNFALSLTNAAQPAAQLTWNSIPGATNFVYYKTNLLSTSWILLTNFSSPTAVPPVGGWPITNVLSDPLMNQTRFYQLRLNTP